MSPSASITSVPGRIPVGVVFVVALTLFAMLPVRADVRIVSGRADAEGHLSSRQGACGSFPALLAIFGNRQGEHEQTGREGS
jgi:hypothetical protein